MVKGFLAGWEDSGKFSGLDFHDNYKPDWSANDTYSTYLYQKRATEIIQTHDKTKVSDLRTLKSLDVTLRFSYTVNQRSLTFFEPRSTLYSRIIWKIQTGDSRQFFCGIADFPRNTD